jgi:hypothetical protein
MSESTRPERRALSAEQMEAATGLQASVPLAPTRRDVEVLTRKRLGPLWGRKRRKLEGWPRR